MRISKNLETDGLDAGLDIVIEFGPTSFEFLSQDGSCILTYRVVLTITVECGESLVICIEPSGAEAGGMGVYISPPNISDFCKF